MGKWYEKKGLAGVLIAAALGVVTAFPVLAAGNTVSSVRISFTDNLEVGEILEPAVASKTSGISIDSVTWGKDREKWTPGKKVAATITLSVDDDREFASSYGSKSCKISGADFSSAKGSGNKLTVIAHYYPVVELDAPETAGWSVGNKYKAVWKKADYATGYQIILYRDEKRLRSMDVSGTSVDLSEYMKKEGYYYYEIRSVGKTKNDAKYRKVSEYVSSTDQPLDDLGDTEGRWKNYAEGKKYRAEDGEYVANEWYKISDQWYYFDDQGYCVIGWKKLGNTWYYMNGDGIMLTGWQKIKDIWYYFNEDGSMAEGWKMMAPGQWYYFNADGSMAANTIVEGKHLDASGLCID